MKTPIKKHYATDTAAQGHNVEGMSLWLKANRKAKPSPFRWRKGKTT
jgi:hypothetical protein